jgi:uncharacterized protein
MHHESTSWKGWLHDQSAKRNLHDQSATREGWLHNQHARGQVALPDLHEHLSCELLVTGQCTMRCSYCIATDVSPITMKVSTGKEAIDLFVYLSEGGKTIEFVLTGGEPLLAFPVVSTLVSYADQRTDEAGMEASFVLKTNGTILNTDIIDFLKSNRVTAVLSMDGTAKAHDRHRYTSSGRGTHRIVRRNLLTLLKEGIPCTVSLTVHPDSVSDVMQSIKYLHKLGVARIDLGPAYGTVDWSVTNIHRLACLLEEIAQYVRRVNEDGKQLEVGPLYKDSEHVRGFLSETWGCHAAIRNLAFLPNGDIAGCSALAMLAVRFPELIIGNSASGIDNDAIDRIASFSQAPREQRSVCMGCSASDNCTGGCLAINYSTTGVPLAPPDLYCQTISSIPRAWQIAWGETKKQQNIAEEQ